MKWRTKYRARFSAILIFLLSSAILASVKGGQRKYRLPSMLNQEIAIDFANEEYYIKKHYVIISPQQTHDVIPTSGIRRLNVTSEKNVVTTLCSRNFTTSW